MIQKCYKILYALSSLQTSLWCLGLYFVLVLVGTFAQMEHGIFYVQQIYFNSLFLYAPINGFQIPFFPGGGLIGGVLILNLILSTLLRIVWTWKKCGILFVHLGLIMLLFGAGLTSCVNKESQIYLKEEDTTFFSEDTQYNELAIIDPSSQYYDSVTSIPVSFLKPGKTVSHDDLPFDIVVHSVYANTKLAIANRSSQPPLVESGIGKDLSLTVIPPFTKDELKSNQTSIISFKDSNETYGSMLVALDINGTQVFTYKNKDYYIQLRPIRYYFPFYMTLKTFTEELYPGSTIPKHYSSLVQLEDFNTKQSREVLIYMNHPLRHKFFTFFQASFGQDEPSSVLQVVYNPIWFLPYVSCLVISFGMIFHFVMSLSKFSKRRTK